MALKKEGAGRLTDQQLKSVQDLEGQIYRVLQEKYNQIGRIKVTLGAWPEEQVREETKKRYKKTGWGLEFHSNQKNEHWVEIFPLGISE